MDFSKFRCTDRGDALALLQVLVIVVTDHYPPIVYTENPDYAAYLDWRKRNGSFSQQQYLNLTQFLTQLVSALHGNPSIVPESAIKQWVAQP